MVFSSLEKATQAKSTLKSTEEKGKFNNNNYYYIKFFRYNSMKQWVGPEAH